MKRLWYWGLDYWYAGWIQLRALFSPRPPKAFASGGGHPVLLIAGVWEPWYFLKRAAERANAAGHPVHIASAIGYNRATVAHATALAREYLEDHRLNRVTVIAHSKGGLIGKQLMATTARVDHVVAIATPFSGSVYANYLPTRAMSEFRPLDDALMALSAQHEHNGQITSIYPSFDPHIPAGSRLDGAVNIEIPMTGHFRVLADERVLAAVLLALERNVASDPGVR